MQMVNPFKPQVNDVLKVPTCKRLPLPNVIIPS